MHPALSIIAFTVSSGLGYGLAIVLGLGLLDASATSTKVAHLLALVLIAGGLASSTLHLHNPQRAWRAVSQWRSSWLSREGFMAIATFVPLGITAGSSLFFDRYAPVSGPVGAAMAIVTVTCTAMIYASLRSVEAWATRLTPLCFVLFALAGGLVLASLFALAADAGRAIPAAAVMLLALAWTAKLFWRNRMLRTRARSTPETATGLGFIGKVRQFESPHTNENYLTREMGFQVARKHAAKLAKLSLLIGGLVPAICLAAAVFSGAGAGAMALAIVGAAFHVVGMLVERWLFFAEARHAVMNYYSR